jgi:hypothetical protein
MRILAKPRFFRTRGYLDKVAGRIQLGSPPGLSGLAGFPRATMTLGTTSFGELPPSWLGLAEDRGHHGRELMELGNREVSFGPGRWYVLEARGAPGLVAGEAVVVRCSGDEWSFLRPRMGQVGFSRVDRTSIKPSGRCVSVTNVHTGMALVLSALPWGNGEPPATLTRVYKGKPEATAQLMREESSRLEPQGYVAVSQQYVKGQWSAGASALAWLLCLTVVGIMALIYMFIVKPDGTLTVAYERRAPTQTWQETAPIAPP